MQFLFPLFPPLSATDWRPIQGVPSLCFQVAQIGSGSPVTPRGKKMIRGWWWFIHPHHPSPKIKKKAICFGSCRGNSSPTVTMHFWLSDSVSLNLHLLEQVQTRLPRLFVKCLRCGKREMWPNREKMKAKKRRRRNSFLIFKLYYID